MADRTTAGAAGSASPGEGDGIRYRLTTGLARAVQRPGGIGGSTTGAEGDVGRTGLADLGDAESLIPPHTGGGGATAG